MTDDHTSTILNAVNDGLRRWVSAFNAGDVEGCVALYEANAVMHAKPSGTFTGTEEIRAYWQMVIAEGFGEAEFIEPKFEVIDETKVLVTGGCRMDQISGVVHKDIWVLQPDGTAKIRVDDFEMLGDV